MSLPRTLLAVRLLSILLFLACACATKHSDPESVSGQGGATSADEESSPTLCPAQKTIVSLTYDDAMPTQLRTAVPALEAHGMRATFFVMDVMQNPQPWAALKAQGHELAAHTFNHPCPGNNSWVAEGKGNEDYDLTRMAKELDDGLAMLKDLGETPPFSFAYPCGETWVGEDRTSYIPLIQERFVAARGVTPALASANSDIYQIPAFFLKTSGEDLIAQAENAHVSGGFIVYGFHGIGGDWETLSTDGHEMLLTFLDENRSRFSVLPFREAIACAVASGQK